MVNFMTSCKISRNSRRFPDSLVIFRKVWRFPDRLENVPESLEKFSDSLENVCSVKKISTVQKSFASLYIFGIVRYISGLFYAVWFLNTLICFNQGNDLLNEMKRMFTCGFKDWPSPQCFLGPLFVSKDQRHFKTSTNKFYAQHDP